MATILIADLFDRSAFVLRAMLRGRRHQVSIATSTTAAFDRLETGLFDLLVVDWSGDGNEPAAVVEYGQQILSGLATIVLAGDRPEKIPPAIAETAAAVLTGPLDGAQLKQALAMAISRRDTAMVQNRRLAERRLVSMSVSVSQGDLIVPCRTFNLSIGGAALAPMLGPEQMAAVTAAWGLERRDRFFASVPVQIGFQLREHPGFADGFTVPGRIVSVREFQNGHRAVWNLAFAPQSIRQSRDLEILLYDIIRQAA